MAQDEFAQLIEFLRSPHSRELSHTQLEAALSERGRELLRVLFQAHVDSRGPGPAAGPVRGADGVARAEQRLHERGLSTLFGEVRVKRLGYGATGLESLHPLDAQLNLPPGEYSLGVRRLAAEQAAQVSFEATVEALAQHTGKTMGKRQVEDLVQRAAVDFDAFYGQHSPAAEQPSASILALSADGKGIVMLPRDLRAPTRKAAAKGQAHKLSRRLSKGEKRNRKRMATVAAVYTVAPYVRTPEQVVRSLAPLHEAAPPRPPVEHKRVWASLEQSPEQVLEEALREGVRRDPGRQKTWVALVDGNATQLELLEALARKHQVQLTIVLDVIHVSEYLWSALARNRSIKHLHVCCLAENQRMQQLARKFDAELTFDFGTVIGKVENPIPTPLSVMRELVVDGHSLAAAYVDFQSRLFKPPAGGLVSRAPSGAQ